MGKLQIILGDDYTIEWDSTEKHFQSKKDIHKWVQKIFEYMPSAYKELAEYKIYVKRIYSKLDEKIYKSKWIRIEDE